MKSLLPMISNSFLMIDSSPIVPSVFQAIQIFNLKVVYFLREEN